MPNALNLKAMQEAADAVAYAVMVRERHRRRTYRGQKQREKDISLACARLKRAMRPLKSEIGRFKYGPQNDVAEANREAIREASRAIQRERRKLHKMKEKKRRTA